MCGIAGIFGAKSENFTSNAIELLKHRGPDDKGVYADDRVTLIQRRLSILDLSEAGHQPMYSSCGRYIIVYNGEIYNHLALRTQYLSGFRFRGHSDTETIIELFRVMKEGMLAHLVGMWAILIWDVQEKKLFISRDRYGQKPLYYRKVASQYFFSSEIKPLLFKNEPTAIEPVAMAEFLATGNYGHLGEHTFFRDIRQFPQGQYAWLEGEGTGPVFKKYWELPHIPVKDKEHFNEALKKELHDCIVEAVLSQTLSDVPIGVTLSGGIDSSVITGILATYYQSDINVFTAQTEENNRYDETRFVNAVIEKYPRLKIHRYNLKNLSLKEDIYRYIDIQEEPFGDPSIIAHGALMQSAAGAGLKVVIGGQGADELFFGYTNMVSAVLLRQLRGLQTGDFMNNIKGLRQGNGFLLRTLLLTFFPGMERQLRTRSRLKRRNIIDAGYLGAVGNNPYQSPSYDDMYEVWKESVYGIHLPHLVHYDDRNAMANSIEGRMPFLDHRIAECVARIHPGGLLKDGLRKYPLREACGQYLPDAVKTRKDKVGFYTPLIGAIYKDEAWVAQHLKDSAHAAKEAKADLLGKLSAHQLHVNDALLIWRFLACKVWEEEFIGSKRVS